MNTFSKGLKGTGTVIKRFSNGFGFIQRDDYPKKSHNLYFHARDAEGWKLLRVGHRVSFTLSQMTKQERKEKGLKNRIAVMVCKIT
ncbi:MAG: Cold-shock DNA-binding domain [Candidatus Parcubacteria bacterium]|jgi:cold shock CspA family protein